MDGNPTQQARLASFTKRAVTDVASPPYRL